jgi:hypothetical protein
MEMTPEERQLITGLFERMRNYGTPEKDREAEQIINDAVRSTTDAPYMLVQSVLVQEHALREAENRIRDLEEQVRSLQGTGQQTRASGSGSFLGGLLGGGRPVSQPSSTSVPPIGSRAAPYASDQDQQRPGSQAGPPPQQPASGGFLRSAMATAAGVAGGVLAAGAIRDLLGGSNANASTGGGNDNAAAGKEGANQTASNADQSNNVEPARDEQTSSGSQDTSYEETYDDTSGWDDGGGDFEI